MVLAASCEDSIFCSKGTHSTTKRSRALSNIFWNGKKTFLYFHLIICWQLWFLGIKPTSNIPSLLYGILCWMVHSRLLDLSLWSWIHPLFLKSSTESSIPGLNCDQGIYLGYSFFFLLRDWLIHSQSSCAIPEIRRRLKWKHIFIVFQTWHIVFLSIKLLNWLFVLKTLPDGGFLELLVWLFHSSFQVF